MGSYYKKQLNDFVANQEVKAKTLFDIGGAQHPIKGRTKSWEVEDYKIIDLAVPHVELQHPDIEWDMNEDINNYKVGVVPMADVIYCLGVSDYIINPNIFMNNIHDMLTSDGHAWVEWPFLYAHHNPIDDEGCRYSHGCIKRLAKQANLEIVEWIWKRPAPDNPFLPMFYSKDGMRCAKGFDHNVTGFITKLVRG